MNYKEFNDYELIDQIHSCNEDANEILIYKYRPLIVSVAQKLIKYCNGGVDLNDLIQEGMLGLNEAINSFRDDREASFSTYARICIQRRIVSLVKSTKTQKNMILNNQDVLNSSKNIGKIVGEGLKNPIVRQLCTHPQNKSYFETTTG